jgi:hypothetical protein
MQRLRNTIDGVSNKSSKSSSSSSNASHIPLLINNNSDVASSSRQQQQQQQVTAAKIQNMPTQFVDQLKKKRRGEREVLQNISNSTNSILNNLNNNNNNNKDIGTKKSRFSDNNSKVTTTEQNVIDSRPSAKENQTSTASKLKNHIRSIGLGNKLTSKSTIAIAAADSFLVKNQQKKSEISETKSTTTIVSDESTLLKATTTTTTTSFKFASTESLTRNLEQIELEKVNLSLSLSSSSSIGAAVAGTVTKTETGTAQLNDTISLENNNSQDWIDIDADERDEFNANDYVVAIFDYYRERENQFVIDDYITRQQHLNKQMRHLLVDWMVEVQQQLEFNHEVLYLSVKLMDLYLKGRPNVQKERLQLLGGASMFIACKFEVNSF